MSIQRYDCPDCPAIYCGSPIKMKPTEYEGDWVKYDDHAALLAQRDAEIARLSAAVRALVEASRG